MPNIVYPSTLPGPTALSLQAMERALHSSLTPGPQDARNIQRDYVAFETLQFRFISTQLAVFMTWWETVLIKGCSWFEATWMHDDGLNAICRFTNGPSMRWIGYEYCEVSIKTEIRGQFGGTTKTAFSVGPQADQHVYDMIFTFSPRQNGSGGVIDIAATQFDPVFVFTNPGTEGRSGFKVQLFSHQLGIPLPDGPTVVITATTTKQNPADPGTLPAVQTATSTSGNRQLSFNGFDSLLLRYNIPLVVTIVITVNGSVVSNGSYTSTPNLSNPHSGGSWAYDSIYVSGTSDSL